MDLLRLPLLRNLHISDNHLLQLTGELLVSEAISCFCDGFRIIFDFICVTESGKTDHGTTASAESRQLSTGCGARFWHFAKFARTERLQQSVERSDGTTVFTNVPIDQHWDTKRFANTALHVQGHQILFPKSIDHDERGLGLFDGGRRYALFPMPL